MTLTATTPFQAPTTLPFAALGEREWLLSCHCAGPVTDLLKDQGWDVVSDLDSNVHCTEGCTGRKRFLATCSCKQWTSNPSSTKTYAAEQGRRHRSDQLPAKSAPPSKGPAVVRELLRFDAEE
ncbi:hypothetical protein OG775_23085 [Streptomyces platensis]|uniref:hypothetical protein n=1 Tax=Streptomyces platensis TaxID=58346 RepID=UPI002250B4B7|nr:hypothetical protein [Streptomyces platensis]MCX4637977.1 hypothetical protein [Streptomyces platensis]